jgi:hypothetical protein
LVPLKINPIVAVVMPNTPLDDDTAFAAVPKNLATREQNEKRAIVRGTNTPSHLKLISQSPADNLGIGTHGPRYPPAMKEYTYDDSLGDGTTVYVIDNGYFLGTQVSNANVRYFRWLICIGYPYTCCWRSTYCSIQSNGLSCSVFGSSDRYK